MRDFLLDILHQLLVQQGICKDAMAGNGGVPMSLLATLTGISRVVANKHTPVQVIAGAMLGFGVSYLVASRYIDPSIDRESLLNTAKTYAKERHTLLAMLILFRSYFRILGRVIPLCPWYFPALSL